VLAFVLIIWNFLRSTWGTLRDPKIRPLAIWLIALLIVGTNFYRAVEDWSWLDSLYFCVITLATVGYGDLTPTTDAGKVFTIFYIIGGIGVLVAVVNATVERATARQQRRFHGRADSAITNPGGGLSESRDEQQSS
jgi:voltage-gated potassium channel